MKAGEEKIKQYLETGIKRSNGWGVVSPFGDRAFYHGDWLLRAAAAAAGIYGNDPIEAVYPFTKVLANGEPLDGSKHNYTITFEKDLYPPVSAFWSVTMYDGKTQLLVENPINRYLINSPMLPQMKKNPDGSLTIYVQKDAPAPTRRPTGCLHRTARSTWSCVSTGQRRRRLRFCRPAKVPGSPRLSRLRPRIARTAREYS
jgi:hypothetical protein